MYIAQPVNKKKIITGSNIELQPQNQKPRQFPNYSQNPQQIPMQQVLVVGIPLNQQYQQPQNRQAYSMLQQTSSQQQKVYQTKPKPQQIPNVYQPSVNPLSKQVRQQKPQQMCKGWSIEGGNFDKVELKYKKPSIDELKQKYKDVVIHKVQPTDSLMGLSIKYGLPAQRIKQANQIFSNQIFQFKELVIPNPSTNYQQYIDDKEQQKERQNQQIYALQRSFDIKDKKDSKMSRYYLEICDWNFKEAYQQYLGDLQFEKDSKKKKKKNCFGYFPLKKYE